MSVAAVAFHRGVHRAVAVQLVLALAVALLFFAASGWPAAVAALYGGAITVVTSWWLGRQVRRAAVTRGLASRVVIYAMGSLRFVVVLALLAIGIGALHLAAPPLITAFSVAKLGFFATLVSG